MSKACIICVAGLPGAGKSSLSAALTKALGAPLIQFDSYERLSQMPLPVLEDWIAANAPLNEALAPGFAQTVAASTGLTIVDGPFAALWPGLEQLDSYTFWIDVPWDIALSRKIRSLALAGRADPRFSDWIAGWLQAYPEMTRRTYELVEKMVRPTADLTLDGHAQTPAQQTKKIQEVLNSGQKNGVLP